MINKIIIFLGTIGAIFYLSNFIELEDFKVEENENLSESEVSLSSEELFNKDKIWENELNGQVLTFKDYLKTQQELEVKNSEPVKILAVGDMMLGRYVRVLMDSYGKNYVFENLDPKFLTSPDLTFGNLEGPIQGIGKKGGNSTNFAFHEDVAPWLKETGFDLVSIANNHALDQGQNGRDSTISALNENNLSWCGHPTEADPESVYYQEINNIKFAFLCFEDAIYRLDYAAAANLISQTKSQVDYLIISIHWGYEYQHTANQERQIEAAHLFIDSGADFIIGHHPHVIQNFEIYQEKFIFYSLGNFLFDQYFSQATQEELAIEIEVSKNSSNSNSVVDFQTTVNLHPIKSENTQLRLMNSEEKAEWLERFINYGDFDEQTKEMIRSGTLKN